MASDVSPPGTACLIARYVSKKNIKKVLSYVIVCETMHENYRGNYEQSYAV